MMQTLIYEWKLDESFSCVFFFFFFWKKCQSGSQSLCISSQHGICMPVAIAMRLLWDQFIWRSGVCRCHRVQLSITKPRRVKAHPHFSFWPQLFEKDFDQMIWISLCNLSVYWKHLPSSHYSVKKYWTKHSLWSVQYIRFIPDDASQDQSAAWHTVSSLQPLSSLPSACTSEGAVRYSEVPAWRMSRHLWRVDLCRSGNTTCLLSSH